MSSPPPAAPPAGFGSPPPQVVGSGGGSYEDDLRAQMAAAAARQGATQASDSAKKSLSEIKAYIQENPTSVKVFCFLIGLTLIVFSILGCFNLFAAAFEPREYLGNLYNVFFGLIICICDGKESWMKTCGDVQGKLFRYAFFLATQTGRALFYLYVGSMTLLTLPDNVVWSLIYVVIGGVLCILAFLMLVINWCGSYCGCERHYVDAESAGVM
eukprot:TRINITY_DN15812_c0_g2_i1.p1 TRINITY_DN15812_c0_g2~~TRINITY_DN15812_c0_g2_i1.p1  ORF type:complete len:213 (+),score=47.26 TRINITY_DN15812_c0_g2_i1:218-856(+)